MLFSLDIATGAEKALGNLGKASARTSASTPPFASA
jgi:hypothetical protein